MNRAAYCAWPPRLAADVEVSPRNEADRPSFIAGSASIGRYLILGTAEHRVFELLDGTRTPHALRAELVPPPQPETLTRFLARLDEVGILAGEHTGRSMQAQLPGSQVYLRWSLFNPDRLFARLLPVLRWIWTPWFFAVSLLLVAGAGVLTLLNWAEVYRYGGQSLRGQYVLVFFVAWLVTVCHEFAHGLTSKAFGGRATEVGVLLIYYCVPALYCNVSGLHLIARRGRRLWVIAAGIYWQVLVGAAALACWFALNPDTLPGRLAMVLVLASLMDVVFNANPLIKLDGYYFLSQWLGMPNLMDRSRAYWRGETSRFSPRERRILCVFGLLSFLYNLAFPVAIVWYAAGYLMDRFYFPGLLLSVLLALLYAWRPFKNMVAKRGKDMETSERRGMGLRRFVPAAIGLCFVAVLCLPWQASVGSYGTLVAIPGREGIIRAPENASLIALHVQPGQQVARGLTIGRMGNLDLEEQIVQVRTELARVDTSIQRLSGELRVQQDTAESSGWQLAQRQREFHDVDSEEQQIRGRLQAAGEATVVLASYAPAPSAQSLPAALAALEADAAQLASRLAEANLQRDRSRKHFAEGLMARSTLDGDEAKSSALAFNLDAARQRLHAALIEHRRRQGSSENAVHIARSSLSAARAQGRSLSLQLQAAERLSHSLGERLALLERKRAEFVLAAPVEGTVFGEELPRMTGQYFVKGAEICRVAATHELLVRAHVAEQAVGDIAPGYPVRVKTRAFPNRVFRGVVSKIGGESELDANGQRTYRVEFTIQNEAGLLRPGMTVFSRVDFGRHMVGWVWAHKLKQALRPEMWML
jgi:putative peptide zinc metalloprotease protein